MTDLNNETVPEWGYLEGVDPSIHYVIGVVLAVIGTVGILGNALVLLVFSRFRRLRGPFSILILNLAVADLCTSCLHVMAVVSSFSRRWVFGRIGCQLYAGGVGHFGLLSIITLAAISVERYMVITSRPLSKSWRITQYDSRNVCVMVWMYCLSMSVPPLVGWSRYVLEGLHTSCSWDYTSRTFANRAYYVYLLTMGFLVPVGVILYCYTFIMLTILSYGRGIASIKENGEVPAGLQPNITSREHIPEVGHPLSSSFRTAEIILVLVILFLVSWTPYALVTLIAQFGDPRLVTPWVAALPAIFAKASVVYNPIVYGLSHPHFRSAARHFLFHCSVGGSVTTLANSQPLSYRRVRVERAAASSPGVLRRPTPQSRGRLPSLQLEFHSEPDPRVQIEDTLGRSTEVSWQPGGMTGAGAAKCTLVPNTTIRGHGRKHKHSRAITSEGLETIAGPVTVLPQPAVLDKTKSKTRSWLNPLKKK